MNEGKDFTENETEYLNGSLDKGSGKRSLKVNIKLSPKNQIAAEVLSSIKDGILDQNPTNVSNAQKSPPKSSTFPKIRLLLTNEKELAQKNERAVESSTRYVMEENSSMVVDGDNPSDHEAEMEGTQMLLALAEAGSMAQIDRQDVSSSVPFDDYTVPTEKSITWTRSVDGSSPQHSDYSPERSQTTLSPRMKIGSLIQSEFEKDVRQSVSPSKSVKLQDTKERSASPIPFNSSPKRSASPSLKSPNMEQGEVNISRPASSPFVNEFHNNSIVNRKSHSPESSENIDVSELQ
jgi:hypothetical protein